ncbi:MAG: energy transducer TonB [bacterium]
MSIAISTIAHSLFFGAIFLTGYNPQPIVSDVIEVSLIETPKIAMKPQAIEQTEQKPSEPKSNPKIKYKTEEKKLSKRQEQTQKSRQTLKQASKPTNQSTGKSSGIRVDSKGFNFGYYLEIIRERVSDNWSPPPVGSDIVVSTIYFRIRKTGEITDIKLEKSSGFELYDRAAIKAVSDAAPLPPLPVGFKDQWLGVHFEFEYKSGG